MRRFLLLLVLTALAAGLLHQAARAQSCDFTVSTINFGSVNLLSGAAVNGSGTLDITCRNPSSVSLFMRVCPNINAGSGGASGTTRRMVDASSRTLDYQLYQDSGRSTSWGSADQTTLGTPLPIDMLLLPLTTVSAPTTTIYAKILASQAATIGGAYSSIFSGAQTRFSYKTYTLVAPACASLADNPTQVSFTVQANVDRTCAVSAQNISFGSHGLLTTQLDALGSIGVTCTSGLSYAISLNGGLSGATLPTQRKMTKGLESVLYGLYGDMNRTQPWGSGVGQTVGGTGSGMQQNLPVYARVQPQTTPSPGNYSDTVVVTVTY